MRRHDRGKSRGEERRVSGRVSFDKYHTISYPYPYTWHLVDGALALAHLAPGFLDFWDFRRGCMDQRSPRGLACDWRPFEGLYSH